MTIKPALTAEEWASPGDVFDGYVDIDRGIVDVQMGGPAGLRDEDRERHALAAICLYGQPFGFTHEDLSCLNATMDSLEYHGIPQPCLESLYARIEALLPPSP